MLSSLIKLQSAYSELFQYADREIDSHYLLTHPEISRTLFRHKVVVDRLTARVNDFQYFGDDNIDDILDDINKTTIAIANDLSCIRKSYEKLLRLQKVKSFAYTTAFIAILTIVMYLYS